MSEGHRRSRRQERTVARKVGGRVNPGSGNGLRKNDVRTDDISIELKWTGKRQITVKADDLEKGEQHAIRDGREFAFGISLNGHNYVILTQDYFEELTDGSA